MWATLCTRRFGPAEAVAPSPDMGRSLTLFAVLLCARSSVGDSEGPEKTLQVWHKAGKRRTGGQAHCVAITSIHIRNMELHQRAKGRGFILNHPIPMPLRAYFVVYDGEGEIPEIENVTLVNLTAAQPWAGEYMEANSSRRESSVTQRGYSPNASSSSYRFRACMSTGLPTIPMHLWPAGPQTLCHGCTRATTCNDVSLIFKVAAMYDALAKPQFAFVMWLDSDAFFQQAPPPSFFDWMTQYDVATIFRPKMTNLPETGIVGFSATPAATQLVKDMRDAYYHYDTPFYSGLLGLNDVHVLGYLMNYGSPSGKRQMLRVGRFATGCRPQLPNPNVSWQWDSRLYANNVPSRPYLDCVEHRKRIPNISPFNMFEYVTHCKGNGPQRQTAGEANADLRKKNSC